MPSTVISVTASLVNAASNSATVVATAFVGSSPTVTSISFVCGVPFPAVSFTVTAQVLISLITAVYSIPSTTGNFAIMFASFTSVPKASSTSTTFTNAAAIA